MPNRAFEAETNNEYRLMALLALTSQELPERSDSDVRLPELSAAARREDSLALYRQLDSDPAALEDFLQRELARIRAARQTTTVSLAARCAQWVRDSFASPARMAVSLGAAALVAILVVQFSARDGMVVKVEQSFAAQAIEASKSAATSPLVLPWEQPRATFGFSTATGNESRGSIAFAKGLLRARERLNSEHGAAASSSTPASYFALGEWNALLWSVARAEQPAPTEFWRVQQALAGEFTAKSYASDENSVILSHLNNVRGLLEPLAKGENSLRTQRLLADELLSFRERFAPHTAALLDRN